MPDFQTYAPSYIKPGEHINMTAENGEIEFIGVYDEKVLDFFAAFSKWLSLTEAPMQVSDGSLEAAARERDRCWKRLGNYTVGKIMERLGDGQIWLPEGGTDNVG